jgi:NIMA (never in mitosis gene a)-related kinase 1/4/5
LFSKKKLNRYNKIKKRNFLLFSEEQILTWITELSSALKHIHDRKILHRDLKTQNIFLDKNNKIKLGDFGIARILKETKEVCFKNKKKKKF